MGQWFECLVARILIIPYQEGWIAIKDTVIEDPSTGNVQVSLLFIPLLIGGFLRSHYILSLALFIPCVVIERIIASLFIRTYEKHPRIYVSTTMLTCSHLLSIFLSYKTVQWRYSYFQIIITFTLVLSTTVTIFAILYAYNSSVTRRLELQHRRYGYHLGKRFQAKENLKSLKLVRRITVVGIFLFLVAALFIALVASQLLPNGFHRISLQLSEIVLNLNPLFVIPPVAVRIPLWKSKLTATIPSIFRKRLSCSQSVRPLEYRARRTVT
ncbi:hypothetical protein CAEBREN_03112, partial [Caenorhabditis brenneri]